jgi:hypothetical protein
MNDFKRNKLSRLARLAEAALDRTMGREYRGMALSDLVRESRDMAWVTELSQNDGTWAIWSKGGATEPLLTSEQYREEQA